MNTQPHSTRAQAPTESSSEINVSTARGNNDDVPKHFKDLLGREPNINEEIQEQLYRSSKRVHLLWRRFRKQG